MSLTLRGAQRELGSGRAREHDRRNSDGAQRSRAGSQGEAEPGRALAGRGGPACVSDLAGSIPHSPTPLGPPTGHRPRRPGSRALGRAEVLRARRGRCRHAGHPQSARTGSTRVTSGGGAAWAEERTRPGAGAGPREQVGSAAAGALRSASGHLGLGGKRDRPAARGPRRCRSCTASGGSSSSTSRWWMRFWAPWGSRTPSGRSLWTGKSPPPVSWPRPLRPCGVPLYHHKPGRVDASPLTEEGTGGSRGCVAPSARCPARIALPPLAWRRRRAGRARGRRLAGCRRACASAPPCRLPVLCHPPAWQGRRVESVRPQMSPQSSVKVGFCSRVCVFIDKSWSVVDLQERCRERIRIHCPWY